MSHALLKLLVFTLPGFSAFLEGHGLPGVLAWPLFLAEAAGGLAILAGVYGRLASALLLPILLGAAWIHLPNGWVFSAAGGGWEYPVFLAVASLVHVILGDGAYRLGRSRGTPRARPA